MENIKNPFVAMPGFQCFGCAPHNKCGLRMIFHREGDNIICKWKPQEQYQGYVNVLHGGIQATLLDELASWVVFVLLKTAGFTSRMNIVYRKPVYTNQGELTVKAKLNATKLRLAFIEAQLYNADHELCTEGNIVYFVYPQDQAREKFNLQYQSEF